MRTTAHPKTEQQCQLKVKRRDLSSKFIHWKSNVNDVLFERYKRTPKNGLLRDVCEISDEEQSCVIKGFAKQRGKHLPRPAAHPALSYRHTTLGVNTWQKCPFELEYSSRVRDESSRDSLFSHRCYSN